MKDVWMYVYEKGGKIHRLFRRLVVMNISTNVVMS